jgi:hypothetical protein
MSSHKFGETGSETSWNTQKEYICPELLNALQFAKVSIHPRLHAIEKTKIFIDLEKA